MASSSARFARCKSPYSTIPKSLTRLLVERQIGRNGRAVLDCLCNMTLANGVFGIKSAQNIADYTGLDKRQVARGMQELKEKGIVIQVTKENRDGKWVLDRSNAGHVAQLAFTREAWARISDGYES